MILDIFNEYIEDSILDPVEKFHRKMSYILWHIQFLGLTLFKNLSRIFLNFLGTFSNF